MPVKWETQRVDMQDAKEIIEKHKAINQGKSLGMIEFVVEANEPLHMKRPDWIIEIAEFFDYKYGVDKGYHVTALVLNQLLLQTKTIH